MPSFKYCRNFAEKSLHYLLWLFVGLALAACDPSQSAATPAPDPNAPVGGYVDVVNYNHLRSYEYQLFDLTQAQAPAIGGGIIWPLSGGGNVNCCIQLPKQWRPGLKVRLMWGEADETIKKEIGSYDRVFEIPKYSEPGNLYISMLPNSQVELVVSKVEPGQPNWPGQIKQTPWDYCVATAGRKACKAVLPKYGVGSWEEMQGFCTYLKDIEAPASECTDMMNRCIDAYEDEPRCKEVLWGERKK